MEQKTVLPNIDFVDIVGALADWYNENDSSAARLTIHPYGFVRLMQDEIFCKVMIRRDEFFWIILPFLKVGIYNFWDKRPSWVGKIFNVDIYLSHKVAEDAIIVT